MTSRAPFSSEFLMQGGSRGHPLSQIVPYEERNSGSLGVWDTARVAHLISDSALVHLDAVTFVSLHSILAKETL